MKRSILITVITSVILTTACNEDLDPPVASFDVNKESAEVGVTISFQSNCQNATSFDWDFGDGSGSSEENPNHVYTAEGTYRIVLTASNKDGSDKASKSIEITPSQPCWTRLADLLEARSHHMVVLINNRIYIMGGLGMSEVEEYDPLTDTWTKKADILTSRQALSACAINGKIYATGGVSVTDKVYATVEEYDPVSDKWTEKTPMPTARFNHVSVAFDGKIYVIGGHMDFGVSEPYNSIEIYDPETDIWTTRLAGDVFVPRWGLSACVIDGKIYTIGGSNSISMPINSLHTVQEYDPVADTWKNTSPLPTARFHASIASVNNRIYVFGGSVNENQMALQSVEAYDPLTDTWEIKTPMPVGTGRPAACELDQLIYVSGGINMDHEDYSYFYVYDPACDAVSNK
jgi:PKD repeat protein